MPPLQPFDKHAADTRSLESCGSTLVSRAAESIINRVLTKKAYSPTVGSVREDRGTLVQDTDRAVQDNAAQVRRNIVWAAVVSRYWSAKVGSFNAEVDRLTSALADETSTHGASGSATGDGKTAHERAEAAWWTAHRHFIEDGGRHAAAMLRDGPTRAHIEVAADAGAMPPMQCDRHGIDDGWNGLEGVRLPSDGTGIDTGIRAGETVSYPLTFAGGAYQQWKRDTDHADLNGGERVIRSATRGATVPAGTYAGIEIAASLGGAIGSFAGPYGTAAGIVTDGLVGDAVTWS